MATDNNPTNPKNVVDLHDIALLLNYERATTEPRFRHTKLREVATIGDFQTVRLPIPEWTNATVPRTGLVFDRKRPPKGSSLESEPDLPSNMVAKGAPEKLRNLDTKTLETLYWQARNHDGCYRTISLFQFFVDLYPNEDDVIFRVRTVENNAPKVFETPASRRIIMEMHLFNQKSRTVVCVLPDNQTYVSGGRPTIDHAVFGFAPPGEDIEAVLDLSSLQFGDVGRGAKGRGLFVLEPIHDYVSRLDRYAEGNDFDDSKQSLRISGSPDAVWLQIVAKRVKERWDNRDKEHWCGHCGAPPGQKGLAPCSRCRQAYYCDKEHQIAAWPFHKHFCKPALIPESNKTNQ